MVVKKNNVVGIDDFKKLYNLKTGTYLEQIKYYKGLIRRSGTLSQTYISALMDNNPNDISVIRVAYDEIIKEVGIDASQIKK